MWQPTASQKNIILRANLLARIRAFFLKRNVLEVETPLLSQHTVTDPYIDSFKTHYQTHQNEKIYYLQTSPEYAMKRLLAAGSGAIYQMTKAFRNGEAGSRHNPEFSMLEWYRPQYNHHDLMKEVDVFLQEILDAPPSVMITYRALFEKKLSLDPFLDDINLLKETLQKHSSVDNKLLETLTRDNTLELLMSECIEPTLSDETPVIVYNFPASQAMLARINSETPNTAERFEAYYKGYEIANGFHELANAIEQKNRFLSDQKKRESLKKDIPEIDNRLISALDSGLPDCAGVAIGIDRLAMISANTRNIQDVISFAWNCA